VLSGIIEDTSKQRPPPTVPIGILPTDLTYTSADIHSWLSIIIMQCKANNLPLLCFACDNAPQHRSAIADWFLPDEDEKFYPFPLEEWPFQLPILHEMSYPIVPLQDSRHWLRCMVAALYNTRRLIMLGTN
jgi:hypothetical protein